MKRIEKTVFISYRRTNAPWALAIYQYLHHNGFDVFFDYISIPAGDFESVILESIRARAHFIVLLTPSALERCDNPKDWLRREIEYALDNKRNIVPLMLEGFDFGMPAIAKHLTGKLEMLHQYNGMTVPVEYFEAAMMKLRDKFLSVELDAVIHPVSEATEEKVQSQKTAAEAAPLVPEEALTAQQWFEKGNLSKDPEEQIRCYSEAIYIEPDFTDAYNNRGNSYNELGQYELAIADFEIAILFDEEDAVFYNNRGISYAELGQYERAIADFDKVIQLEPEYAEAYNNRGISYANLGQHERSIAEYDKAIQIAPEFASPLFNKACAYALQHQVTFACSWLRRAIQMDPNNLALARTDTDFDPIRETPEFQALLIEID